MAAFAAGIFNHATSAAQSFATNPLAGPTTEADGSSSTSTSSSSITANDFLTLLVTEMKNQDPTANTDPNEYINQLVNVNSLEQLIDINQNLQEALGVSSSSSHASTMNQSATVADSSVKSTASGNLSIPHVLPAAQSVAHALSQQPHH